MKLTEMPFSAHFEELRKRVFIIALFFVLAFVAGLFFAKPLIVFLQQAPSAEGISMNAFSLTDPLYVYMQFAFVVAVVMTAPMFMYQLWSFISPGLYERERRVTLMYIPLTVLLFLAGLSFSYFLLFPFVVDFMLGMTNDLKIEGEFGIYQYFSFLFQLTIPFGFLFQLPLLAMFLTRLGVITPQLLVQGRKYAYFGLLVVAGIVTPPELLSHLMVTVPLLLLYEVSIVISRFAYRKAVKAEQAYHE
jgi:sec-independent protein translocase protein TatC